MAKATCNGCDDPTVETKRFKAVFVTGKEDVTYCQECHELALINHNMETISIKPLTWVTCVADSRFTLFCS